MQPFERRLLARPAPQPEAGDYGRIITLTSLAFGVVGFLFGVCWLIIFIAKNGLEASIWSVVAGILFTAAVFWALGLGITCLFAPTIFLEGPSGQVWLAKIGVKSVLAARVACACYVLFVAAIVVLGLYIAVANH